MNYETAKKLKDAGFPQKTGSPSLVFTGFDSEPIDITVYYPTLSELKEACGDEFRSLLRQHNPDLKENNTWFKADSNHEEQSTQAYASFEDKQYTSRKGLTPEEAVANLYLAIKNK